MNTYQFDWPDDEEVEPPRVADIGIAPGPARLEGDRPAVGGPDRVRVEVRVDERKPAPIPPVATDRVEVAVARVEEEAPAVAKPAPIRMDHIQGERRGDRDQPAARRRRDAPVDLRADQS